jgi:hypothetical protein
LFSINKTLFKTIFTTFILLLLFNFTGYGQIDCSTRDSSESINYSSLILSRGVYQPNAGPYCLNIFFHIVRESNGTGGFDPNQIEDVLDNLNEAFNPHNIFITNGGLNFIDDSNLFSVTITYSTQNNQYNTSLFNNSVNNSINFYLVNSIREITFPQDNFPNGVAQKIESKNFIIRNDKALSQTSTHELGHCLNLFHTHRGTAANSSGCAEATNGSNCQTCGDLVCDTPSDPSLGPHNINENCEYIGGGGYNPDVTNIMSYGRTPSFDCRTNFSNGQGQRMRDALQESNLLQQVIVSNAQCGLATTVGDNIICADEGTIVEIINSEPPYNWSVTPNLIITENNGSSITVVANNYYASETGKIWVSHFGVGQNPIEINVWLGRPQSPESIYGPDIVNSGAIVSYQGGVAQGATSYVWWLPYPFDIVNPIDYFNDNWQMYPNNTRFNSQVFTGYGANNGYVQIMGVNKCGIGPVVYMEVAHDNNGGGSGQLPIVNPYPNAADNLVNLDFSEYPEGTYYIYIYDIYGILKYYGETSNTLKTISTINLPNGLYFLNYYNGMEIIQMQLLVQH